MTFIIIMTTQVYLEYQRQMALQRMQEQEQQMHQRLEQQKQQHELKAKQYAYPQVRAVAFTHKVVYNNNTIQLYHHAKTLLCNEVGELKVYLHYKFASKS